MQLDSAGLDKDGVLGEYGVKVNKEMEKVMGRVLPAPAIQYKDDKTVRDKCVCLFVLNFCCQILPKNGVWNMQNHQFCSGINLTKWVVAVCATTYRPPNRDDIW